MQFRPCIDIHNGAVRQIVGGSLKDEGDQAITNFTSEYDAQVLCKSLSKRWYSRRTYYIAESKYIRIF